MLQRFLVSVSIALAIAAPVAARQRGRASSTEAAPPAPAPCLQFYLDRTPPTETAPGADERRFCHSFYVANYSTVRKDPVWTSYLLTAAMARAVPTPRISHPFAPQAGLDPSLEASDDGFDSATFDRGHMTPDHDAPGRGQETDTYVVTNIVPQISGFNRGLWARIEGAVHNLAISEREVYIVTGPIFAEARRPMNGVAVPSSLFKAIYVPSRHFALAFIAINKMPSACRIVPITQVQQEAGVDPFPSLPADAKSSLPAMPRGWGHFPKACHQ
jgi:endonuclease G